MVTYQSMHGRDLPLIEEKYDVRGNKSDENDREDDVGGFRKDHLSSGFLRAASVSASCTEKTGRC